MAQTAQIIAFPDRRQEFSCVCCKFRHPYDKGSKPAQYDLDANTIEIQKDANGEAFTYYVDEQSLPAASSGNICNSCIEILVSYDRVNAFKNVKAPSYEVSFTCSKTGSPGYAFMCMDLNHWTSFVAEMRKNFNDPELQPTQAPIETSFPCFVVCRYIEPESPDAPQLIETDILSGACIYRTEGDDETNSFVS